MQPQIITLISQLTQALFKQDETVELSRPEPKFGDFATNIALKLSQKLNQPPRQIAEKLADALRESGQFAEVSVAGPGFINLRLTDQALLEALKQNPEQLLAGKTVVVEYSDPNPFKPLHAGHLYTTLVGDIIARLIENAGAKTVRINYGGDVGLHVGKSMWAIIKFLGGENPDKLNDVAETERPAWLGDRYVEGNNAYEDDETLKAEIIAVNKRVYQLHEKNDHDSGFAQIYWTTRQWSYDYFAELYRQLQAHNFDRFLPESEVTPLGLKTVREQLEAGVFEKSTGGAVIFKGENFDLHTRVFINSDGLPTYETKDVGLSLTKWRDYQFDQSIIITANEQAQYMQVVIAAIKQFAAEPAIRTKHITHGVVKLSGGVKMSSRTGNVVLALDILDAARAAGQATGNSPSDDTILAAVKYAFAKNRIGGDIVYDPKESIALEGNSGPYLQYAHARATSLLRKSEIRDSKLETNLKLEIGERNLALKLSEYNEVVQKATTELLPHYICRFLFELAQEFNRFYETNRIIGDPREAERLWLVEIYAATLKNGLNLLGINAPKRL